MEKKDVTIANKEKTAEGTVKTPAKEVTEPVKAAPDGEKPVKIDAAASEIDKEDVDQLITVLNEIDTAFDGKGGIAGIPPEIKGVIKVMIDQMVGFREAFDDPYFKAVLDDMLDQRADGKTPSMLVAIARTIPYEELQQLADGGAEEPIQEAIAERASGEQTRLQDEANLDMNIEASMAAEQAYVEEMGYDETESAAYHGYFMQLMEIFGDGKVTKAEHEMIDKGRNYDVDIDELKGQIPVEPEKEIIPDKASMDNAMAPAPEKKSNNSFGMGAYASTPAYLETGKRKIFEKK